MLILNRRQDESVVIEVPPLQHTQRIVVMVTKSDGQVKLGFEAGSEVLIIRDELMSRGGS